MAYESLVPIPGMRSDARIEENLGAAAVGLTAEEYASLTAELDKLTVYGDRRGLTNLASVPGSVKQDEANISAG